MKVLIIDDNRHHAELASIRLRDQGWSSVMVTSPDPSALPADLSEFDIAVVDYQMPGASGFEVMKELERRESDLPVVMLTGHGSEETAIAAIKRGAFDYLVKDTQLEYLKKLPISIEEALKKYKLMQTNKLLIEELRRANETLKQISMTDDVTGVYNFRFLSQLLDKEMQRSRRYLKSLSIAVLDIDHFKQINDAHGHPFGNFVLETLAKLFQAETRSVDFVTRFGGDEFVIVFPDTTLEAAERICDRILARVRSTRLQGPSGAPVELSVSMGLAGFDPALDKEPAEFIARADSHLYDVKRRGRDGLLTDHGERRSAHRATVTSLPLLWKTGVSQRYETSPIQNLSEQGLLFQTHRPITVSSVLRARIPLPEFRMPIETVAEVIHVQRREHNEHKLFDVGIRFLNLAERDQQKLTDYLTVQRKDPSPWENTTTVEP